MASPPRWWLLPFSFFWMVLAPGRAEHDADSVQSNRGDHVHVRRRDTDEEEVPPKRSNARFILDSLSSSHATAERWLLSGFVAQRAAVIVARDGRELPVAGAGTVRTDKFQLPGVLHSPDLAQGTVLVSVQQLAARGYSVLFGGGRCIVMGRDGGKVVGEGRLADGGLYCLQFLKIPNDAAATADGADNTTV